MIPTTKASIAAFPGLAQEPIIETSPIIVPLIASDDSYKEICCNA